jgi:hypothetical protein
LVSIVLDADDSNDLGQSMDTAVAGVVAGDVGRSSEHVIVVDSPSEFVDSINTSVFAAAFPCLYPSGKGDFLDARDCAITLKGYVQHCVRLADSPFSQNMRWLFCAFSLTQKKSAMGAAKMADSCTLVVCCADDASRCRTRVLIPYISRACLNLHFWLGFCLPVSFLLG